MEMNKTRRTLICLMRCALRGEKPEPVQELDYEALYRLSVAHSVTAMTAMALESGGLMTEEYMSASLIKKWKEAKVKAIRKNVLFDAEREEIFKKLDEEGIWYLPLKGSILKDYYPKMGMRQMSDNDILFDKTCRSHVKEYMQSRGYEVVFYKKGVHDTYDKPPIYHFEFHVELFSEHGRPEWVEYYKDIKKRLVKDTENRCGYHFTDEDFYIYILAHGNKHYWSGGTGIRFLSDIFVFLQKKNTELNWAYIREELKVLGLDEFETETRELAMKLFGDVETENFEEDEYKLLSYIIGSGTYGTLENHVNIELKKMQGTEGDITWKTRLIYAFKRLFPDYEFMSEYSKFCAKHKWSLPFFWVYRPIKALILRRKEVCSEIKAIKK